ncbi:MAG: iron-containing alcohol dehydrogenase [Oscillospiraceae bacterium]|nr:iron-containing alcohol dehydrogenase [Oscillospiraceae bacterium]
MTWEYTQPVDIIFGCDKRLKVFETAFKIGLHGNAVLVCDPALERLGYAHELCALPGANIVEVFTAFGSNPETKDVDALAELLSDSGAEYVIAIGGGSAMDCAKAASVTSVAGVSVEELHGTGKPLPEKGIPLIAIPSTAGTGSEVTAVSVLTNSSKNFKAPMFGKAFYPRVAIVDPVLTYGIPSRVAAQTGMDVLAHAIEGYVSINHQPVCDALCIEAARIVFEAIEDACTEPINREAKDYMAQASVMAGMGFALPKTGPSHACSFALTNRFGIPHGEACALTLDFFVRLWNGTRIDTMAVCLGFADASAMAGRITELKHKLGLRTDLSGLGLTADDIPALVKASKHPNMDNSPVIVTEEYLTLMYGEMINSGEVR